MGGSRGTMRKAGLDPDKDKGGGISSTKHRKMRRERWAQNRGESGADGKRRG